MFILYKDTYEWVKYNELTSESIISNIQLEIYSPVNNPKLIYQLNNGEYFLVIARENPRDNGYSITGDAINLISKILYQFGLPSNRTIVVEWYEDILEGNSRYPLIYNLIEWDVLNPNEGIVTFNQMFYHEILDLKEGKKINIRLDPSIGWQRLYERYKQYV